MRGKFVFDEEAFATERDTENTEMIFERLLPELKKTGSVMGTRAFQNATFTAILNLASVCRLTTIC